MLVVHSILLLGAGCVCVFVCFATPLPPLSTPTSLLLKINLDNL